jgi:hypothetical protein
MCHPNHRHCHHGPPLPPPPPRSYLVRKAKGDARRLASQPPADEAAAEALWQRAVDDLAAFRRQEVVYGLYGRKFKTVLVRQGCIRPCSCVLEGCQDDAPDRGLAVDGRVLSYVPCVPVCGCVLS